MLRRFVELHGDRAGLDDPAMVCGLASMGGVSFMFIGHQKGRNTKVPTLHPCPPDVSHPPECCGTATEHGYHPSRLLPGFTAWRLLDTSANE